MPTRFSRAGRFIRSMRFQLAFWNTLGALVILLSVSLGFYLGVGFLLVRELDQVLDEDCREFLLLVGQGANSDAVRSALARKVESHTEQLWYGRLKFPDGSIIEAGPIPEVVSIGGWGVADGRRHVADTCLVQLSQGSLKVQVGSSLSFVAEDLGRMRLVLAVVGLAMLIISPVLGYWLAGRATEPLGTMLSMARTLQPAALDGRLPQRGVGDELDLLAQTINGLLDRIQQYTIRQRDFVANAAHELRSPLAAVKASIELSLDRPPTIEQGRETLLDVLEELESLTLLVNRLLLLAESDAGGLVAAGQTTDLSGLCQRVIEMFGGVAEQRGIRLECGTMAEGLARGDRGMLKQVLCNLLDNALKNTPPGGTVRLNVETDHRANPCWLTFSMTDTGPGFPKESLPQLFERFSQAGFRVRSGGGTGLGLSICKAIVDGCGGSIQIDNSPAGGARVVVKLPGG